LPTTTLVSIDVTRRLGFWDQAAGARTQAASARRARDVKQFKDK
jgi:hypothetical protein